MIAEEYESEDDVPLINLKKNETDKGNKQDNQEQQLEVGTYVAALYGRKWYIAQVLSIEDPLAIKLSFMKHFRRM